MGIRGYTKNYKLIKPEYDTDTWHDYEYDNLDTIDAVMSAIYASGDWQGFWKNDTSYKAGSVVIDQNTDTMYKVVTEHTTDGNVTFAEYMFNHPEYYQLWSPNNLAQDWAIKDDGLADNQDYSAKAYAVGGVGTETNNAKYYSEQAGIQAGVSAEQAAASASSATASHNSEQLALSHAYQSASSAATSLLGSEQSAASATISQEQAELSRSHAEYAANEVAGLEAFTNEKQAEINTSLAEALEAAEVAKRYAIEASGANVGDIFYTSRLDNELNGAVEANGGVYAVADFTGEQSVPELLRKGSLPSVSMSEYESIVSAHGSCRAWGWDNGDTFRVPTAEKQKRILVAKKEATNTDLSWYNLYSDGWLEQGGFISAQSAITDLTVSFLKPFSDTKYIFNRTAKNVKQYGNNYASYWDGSSARTTSSCTFKAEMSSWCSGYDWQACGYTEIPSEAEYQFQNIEVQRAMVQLSTGATDEALTTCTGVLADVADLKAQSLVVDIQAMSGTVMLADNKIHTGTIDDAVTFTLPTVTDTKKYHQIKAMLYLPVVTIDWGTAHYIGGEAPDISEAGQYMIYWDYVPALNAWAVGAMKVV